MSYFAANSISISKDLKTFKLKGGDNNVVPRSNYWTKDINIEELFDLISSGGAQLISKTEKALFINTLVFEENKAFGGDWNKETDYWHMNRHKSKSEKVINFNKQFLVKLIDGLKNISNKKEYIVYFNNFSGPQYVSRLKQKSCSHTPHREYAILFPKYRAKYIVSNYSYLNAIMEKI